METFIVYLDDKPYALQQIVPMLPAKSSEDGAANWILIGCPPRLNRHTGRWLTHAAQKKWRQEWTREATDELRNMLLDLGNTVSMRTVEGPLWSSPSKSKARWVLPEWSMHAGQSCR